MEYIKTADREYTIKNRDKYINIKKQIIMT